MAKKTRTRDARIRTPFSNGLRRKPKTLDEIIASLNHASIRVDEAIDAIGVWSTSDEKVEALQDASCDLWAALGTLQTYRDRQNAKRTE